MRVIDITRELLSAPVYPGDPAPSLTGISRLDWGDPCNLSALSLCLHNGTHLDVPLHFIPGGEDAATVPLDACVGECCVVEWEGVLLGQESERLLDRLRRFRQEDGRLPRYGEQPCVRLLLKGDVSVSPSAAFVLSGAGLRLLGVETASVADDRAAEVHRQLLGSGVVLLEGLDLSAAEEGWYYLFAPPLKISGGDGAPVRAVLVER